MGHIQKVILNHIYADKWFNVLQIKIFLQEFRPFLAYFQLRSPYLIFIRFRKTFPLLASSHLPNPRGALDHQPYIYKR